MVFIIMIIVIMIIVIMIIIIMDLVKTINLIMIINLVLN